MAFVYSCCFWFSLRLGGILIGIFSLLQKLLTLIALCVAYARPQDVSDEIADWMSNMNLIFTKDYLEIIKTDPEKCIGIGICLTCIYLFVCVLYIYGAYTCNNVLMIPFILAELVRLIMLSSFIIIWLLVLKQNTMDIGLLIGASVAGGFILLGMFYLWVCAANLPVLINEIERDEQAATISKLRKLLETNPMAHTHSLEDIVIPLAGDTAGDPYRSIFMVSKNTRNGIEKPYVTGSRIPVPFYR